MVYVRYFALAARGWPGELDRGDSAMAKNGKPGFFRSLFDFQFRYFISLKIAGIMYAIYTFAAIAAGLIFMIYAATQGGNDKALYILLTPVVVFLFIVLLRLSIELTAVIFRMKESIDDIRRAQLKLLAEKSD